MHIHNSCTRNGNNLNLLIKTSRVDKERMLPQTTVSICKKYEGEGLKYSENNNCGQMLGVFKLTEINYLVVSPFFDLVRPLSYLYLQRLVSCVGTKANLHFPNSLNMF